MKKTIVALSAFAALSLPAAAGEVGPKETIVKLFDAMRAGDKDALMSLWTTEAPSIRRVTADGQLRPDGLQRWSEWVGSLNAGDADEQIFDVKVQEFGNMATVWAPFKVSLKGKLVGCGVNTFILAKVKDQGWKIVTGMDTNHNGDCTKYPEK